MNSANAEDTVLSELRSRDRQQSLWYTAMLTGVVSAAYMPLAYWGLDGIFLCIWIAAIGLALVHELLIPATSLILLGILVSTRVELPLSTLQQQSIESPNSGFEPGDLVIPIAATFGVGIVLMAAIAWAMTTMPDDVKKFIKSFDTRAHFSGLQAAQFSLFHLLGLMTVVCLAAAPVFYGGLAAGFSKSPLILLGGMLAIYQRYGLAFGMLVILVFGYILF